MLKCIICMYIRMHQTHFLEEKFFASSLKVFIKCFLPFPISFFYFWTSSMSFIHDRIFFFSEKILHIFFVGNIDGTDISVICEVL